MLRQAPGRVSVVIEVMFIYKLAYLITGHSFAYTLRLLAKFTDVAGQLHGFCYRSA